MNVWECDHPGCKRECLGTGGAIGLRAIGWWFKRGSGSGPTIYCPEHRPDRMKCLESADPSCALCCGEVEAAHWQDLIERELGIPPLELISEIGQNREKALRDAWDLQMEEIL